MIIFLEIFANFFKLSGLMGIESGLIYNKSGINYLKTNSTGAVFEKKVYTDKNGYRVPNKNFSYQGEKNILIIKKLAMNKFVNFVESILCLSHPEFLRFSQTKSFER